MSGFVPLDGPALYGAISVGTTAVELKVGASKEEGRKVITIQPLDGPVYFGYDSSVTTATGTKIFKSQFFPMECAEDLEVWLIAESGTVDVRITEVG